LVVAQRELEVARDRQLRAQRNVAGPGGRRSGSDVIEFRIPIDVGREDRVVIVAEIEETGGGERMQVGKRHAVQAVVLDLIVR